MERQTTTFLSILSIAAIILLIFFLAIYFFPERVNVEINELKEEVATLQKEATLGAERADKEYKEILETALTQESSFTATRQALIDEVEYISQTTKSIAASATSVSKDATAIAGTIDLLGTRIKLFPYSG